jgi:hypothetical protein
MITLSAITELDGWNRFQRPPRAAVPSRLFGTSLQIIRLNYGPSGSGTFPVPI